MAATDEQRADVDKSGKKTWTGPSTLHHMISKVVLDEILVDLDAALRARDVDLIAAAGEFNSALTNASGTRRSASRISSRTAARTSTCRPSRRARGPLYIKAGFTAQTFTDQPQKAKPAAAPSSRRKKRDKAEKADALPSTGWLVTIKTIAPDGPNADAYTRDELTDIMEALGRTVIPEEDDEEDEEDE